MARIQNATWNALEHNYRKSLTDNEVFFDEQNEHLHSIERAREIRNEWLTNARKAHIANTGRKPQKSIIENYSLAMKVSADTTPQELNESVGKFLKESLGVEIWGISIHKDEGYLIDKQNGRKLASGVDFFYNSKDGAYYADKDFKELLAKDYDELAYKYEIHKNYHAHIEFSGLRADGSSIRKSSFSDRKKERKEWSYKALDKGFLHEFPQMAHFALNEKLKENGKEPVKIEFNADENVPKQKRTKAFKYLQSQLEKDKHGIAMSESERKAYETNKKRAGLDKIELYNENKALQNELKATKSAIKAHIKEVKMPYFNDKFDFLKESKILKESEYQHLLKERKAFFEDLSNFTKDYDIKSKGVAQFLNDLNAFEVRFDKIEQNYILALEKDCEILYNNQNEPQNDKNGSNLSENENLTQISVLNANFDLSHAETQILAQSYANEINTAFKTAIDEQKPNDERLNALNKFERLICNTAQGFIDKIAKKFDNLADFIDNLRAKLSNKPPKHTL